MATSRFFHYSNRPGWDTNQWAKETVPRDFRLPDFSSFEPAWDTDQWVKIFSILVKFSVSYSNFSKSPRGMVLRWVSLHGHQTALSQPPRSMILRWVNSNFFGWNLPGVWYCGESVTLGYHTALSYATKFFVKYPRSMILRQLSQSPQGIILRGVTHDPGESASISL